MSVSNLISFDFCILMLDSGPWIRKQKFLLPDIFRPHAFDLHLMLIKQTMMTLMPVVVLFSFVFFLMSHLILNPFHTSSRNIMCNRSLREYKFSSFEMDSLAVSTFIWQKHTRVFCELLCFFGFFHISCQYVSINVTFIHGGPFKRKRACNK